jgi:uncharacterized damage-inducible protein DinB
MDVAELLTELYGRIPPLARTAVEGLDVETLVRPPGAGANTVAWLVWHLTRVEDDHVAGVAGTEQVWAAEGWAHRFGLDPDTMETGYGHTAEQVAAVRPDGPDTLLDYLDAVHAVTTRFLRGLSADDLERVVDRNWDPPVTMGVRLVSVVDDALQHAGQAAYVRGLLAT